MALTNFSFLLFDFYRLASIKLPLILKSNFFIICENKIYKKFEENVIKM